MFDSPHGTHSGRVLTPLQIPQATGRGKAAASHLVIVGMCASCYQRASRPTLGASRGVMTLILTVEAGGADGEPESPYRVEGDMIVVGRSRNCDWCLPDPTNAISSRHCEIRHDGDAWLVKD